MESVLGPDLDGIGIRLEALSRPALRQGHFFDARPEVLTAVRQVHHRYPASMRRARVRQDVIFPEESTSFESADPGQA